VNHAVLQQIASARGVAFIPGIELSPSWGHFNAYPLTPGARLAIDTSTATIDMILKEGATRRRNGRAGQSPIQSLRLFRQPEGGRGPGGFNPGFDLIEIKLIGPQ